MSRLTMVCTRGGDHHCGLYGSRCRLIVEPEQLRPMREKGQPTKRRIERSTKGQARA